MVNLHKFLCAKSIICSVLALCYYCCMLLLLIPYIVLQLLYICFSESTAIFCQICLSVVLLMPQKSFSTYFLVNAVAVCSCSSSSLSSAVSTSKFCCCFYGSWCKNCCCCYRYCCYCGSCSNFAYFSTVAD